MAGAEGIILVGAAFLGYFTRHQSLPVDTASYLISASSFSVVLVISMAAMGVYEARVKEGYVGMMLRTAVAIFLLGTMGTALLSYFFSSLAVGRGVLLLSMMEGFVLIAVWRWLSSHLFDDDTFKSRVLVLGGGHRALKIAGRMRRKSDQRGFILLGFMDIDNRVAEHPVYQFQANVIRSDLSILDYCRAYDVHEIVVAMDERRRDLAVGGGLPLEELMACRSSGIHVSDVQMFIEREACKIDVDLLRPSWLVFSAGFATGRWHALIKRTFDITASVALLTVTWPIMLLTALCIGIGNGFKQPAFYRQRRVGLNGGVFRVVKFRSMNADDEDEAQWTERDDPRITRIGAFIRKTRIDELPQLFNVLKGEMSFVGPRPERPMFVDELSKNIPFYDERHRIKPGITGWAQLCYPYGASIQDSKEKLQYDLYYLKNQSLLLDLIILLQTVEVVLVGEGAR